VKTLLTGLILLLAAPNKEPDVAVPPGVWKPLPPSQPGEWRWRYPEQGQTFSEYKAAQPTGPTATRQTVYLQPFFTRPPPDATELERIAAMLEGFFDREVSTLPPRALPAGAYVRERRQVDVLRLLALLSNGRPSRKDKGKHRIDQKIIDDYYLGIQSQKLLRYMRSNKTGTTGDNCFQTFKMLA